MLIHKAKPLLENIMGEFKGGGLIVKDGSLDVVAVQAKFSRKFFLEYEAPAEGENIPLTKTLMEPLREGFKDEKIEVFTDQNQIVMKGATETYNEPLVEREVGEMPTKMVMTKLGIIPEKMNPENPQIKGALLQVLVKAEDLQSLPTAEQYDFSCVGKELTISVKDVGEYTKTIKPTKIEVIEDLKASFDGAYFGAVVNNLEGEVWMSMTKAVVVFSQKTKDMVLTYLLSSQEE